MIDEIHESHCWNSDCSKNLSIDYSGFRLRKALLVNSEFAIWVANQRWPEPIASNLNSIVSKCVINFRAVFGNSKSFHIHSYALAREGPPETARQSVPRYLEPEET